MPGNMLLLQLLITFRHLVEPKITNRVGKVDVANAGSTMFVRDAPSGFRNGLFRSGDLRSELTFLSTSPDFGKNCR